MKKIISLTLGALLLFVLAGCEDPKSAKKQASTSGGEVKTLKCQTVLNAKGDEVIMLVLLEFLNLNIINILNKWIILII